MANTLVVAMACSSHLGHVLLLARMLAPTLFLNLDDAHASDKKSGEGKRRFNPNCSWPRPEPMQ